MPIPFIGGLIGAGIWIGRGVWWLARGPVGRWLGRMIFGGGTREVFRGIGRRIFRNMPRGVQRRWVRTQKFLRRLWRGSRRNRDREAMDGSGDDFFIPYLYFEQNMPEYLTKLLDIELSNRPYDFGDKETFSEKIAMRAFETRDPSILIKRMLGLPVAEISHSPGITVDRYGMFTELFTEKIMFSGNGIGLHSPNAYTYISNADHFDGLKVSRYASEIGYRPIPRMLPRGGL